MEAVKRFDLDRGVRLATYAMWWIRATIQQYILHSWSLVKLGTTAAQKKLFFKLRRTKGLIRAIEEGDVTPEHVKKIAEDLRVPEAEVVEMNRRLAGHGRSLNAIATIDGAAEWQDWLVDDSDNQETRLGGAEELERRQQWLQKALDTLKPRERDILIERRLRDKPTTLEALSQKYSVTRERVRQIEVRALGKLQGASPARAKKGAFLAAWH